MSIERTSLIEAFVFMLLQSVGVSFYLFMPLWGHLVTFRSLQRRIAAATESPRYNLTDVLILMTLIAIGTSIGSYAKIDRFTENWILIVSLNLLLILMWYKCTRIMQTNGIFENKSRIAMQVFTYPSSIFALSFFLLSGLLVLIGTVGSFAPNYDDITIRELPNNLFCFIVASVWMYLTRRSFSLILQRNPITDSE